MITLPLWSFVPWQTCFQMLWIYLLSDMVKYRGRTWNGRVFHPECALHFSGVYLHLQAKSSGFINFIRDGAWIVDSGGQESQHWVSWLWWSLVDVEISPTKITIPKAKLNAAQISEMDGIELRICGDSKLGACQTEFLFESNEFHAEEIKVFRNKSLWFYIDLL